tara:strand:- start:247 stop:2049 length:1803 start_codon:yes stop_codon:yes gene_type:complete
VGFIQSGTGAVATTMQAKGRETVSFADFGCVGSGDETTKVQAAFTYASTYNKRLRDYSGNTYTYTTDITCGSVELEGNVTFTGTAAKIDIGGSIAQVGYVSAAATKGKNTVTLSSVTGIAAGDLLIIQNTAAYSFSAHRSYYYDGEFVRVASVDTGTKVVTLESTLLTSYGGTSADKVFEVSAITAKIFGCTFTGTGAFALRVQYAQNSVIAPTSVTGTGSNAAFALNKCYNTTIFGGKYRFPYAGGSDEYGINIVNSQIVRIMGVDAFGGRHGITTGGDDTDGAVPCRFIYTTDSLITNSPSSSVYAADFHGNTSDSYYKNCTVFGAVGLAGYNPSCIDCRVYTWPSSNDIPLSYHELVGGNVLFQNNTVFIGYNSTATEIVGITSSALANEIDLPYTVIVDGLDATLNSAVTSLVSAYEDSGQANAWILNNFGVRGTLSGLTTMVAYTKAAGGTDASFIYITNPQFATSSYTLVSKSGTTLASCRFVFPEYIGSTSDGSYTKSPDGTMICRQSFSIAATAINTAFLGGFRSSGLTWTFPAAFLAATTPQVTITPTGATAFGAANSSTSTTNVVFFLTAVSSQGAATITCDLVAVGRWF